MTLVGVTMLSFVLLEWSIEGGIGAVVLGACPRDAVAGPCSDIIDTYRLNDPLLVRYFWWAADAARGDLNTAMLDGVAVSEVITHRWTITTQLALQAIVLAVGLAIPLGVYSAYADEAAGGRLVSGAVQTFQSIPAFVSGLVLIWIFSEQLGWFPATGWTRLSDSWSDNLRRSVLPTITLALAEIGVFARVARADLLSTFGADFVQAATAKGLPPRSVLFRHVLRPSSLGLVTVVGLNLSALLGGAVIVEIVFGIGGLGPRLFEAIMIRDIYVVQGITLYLGVVYVSINALVDVVYRVLDPRV